MKQYKYIHILWNKGTLFFPSFVKMISENPDLFVMDEHCFVTIYKENYDVLYGKCNIILEKNNKCNLINHYGKYAKWLIVHSMGLPFYRIPFIRKKNAKKVIWRTWGHDIRPYKETKIKLVNIGLKIFFRLYIKKVQQFAYVGIANDIDRYSVEKYFGKMKYCKIPYAYDVKNYPILCEIRSRSTDIKNRKQCNILVGHSGFKIDNHLEALEKLSRFSDNDIKVFLPLSYGDFEYIKEVTKKAKELFGNKAIIITERMEYLQYAEFLSKIDIAIFNQVFSSALGNFSLLLFFNATIFFNSQSCFVESFKQNQIFDFMTVEQLENMTYEELLNVKMSPKIKEIYRGIVPARLRAELFSKFLKSLK